MPRQAAKNGERTPSRSTSWTERKRMRAWATVRRGMRPPGARAISSWHPRGDGDRPALAQRAQRGQADDERRTGVGGRDGRLGPALQGGDEGLPFEDVARHVALEEEVRQRRPALPARREDRGGVARGIVR